MDWRDIAAIVFVCVTANHLGLISAVIGVFCKNRKTLPVISCPKCLSFWGVLIYGYLFEDILELVSVLAISLFAAYSSMWVELAEGIIDKLYNYVYGKIYPTTDTSDADAERA